MQADFKWTEARMQDCLTSGLFHCKQYASVPNVSWGLLSHGEADLLCLSKSGVFHEVEIKISKSDLIADAKKHRGHEHANVPYCWFAVPTALVEVAKQALDIRFGIVECWLKPWPWEHPKDALPTYDTRVIRRPKRYAHARDSKPTQDEIIKFLRLGVMRMWTRRHPEVML
ncbi:MAG: hypothetical protein ABFD89_17560 [Bryobacteraceae bacterium]